MSKLNQPQSFAGGNIIKTIKRLGTGPKPTKGSTVNCHYVGTLENGQEFDSSRKRGKKFSFVLGAGRVIRGWDEGIATMNQGELADFKIQPGYAYGSNGINGVIPPNAVLNFEVELF